ncbi:MAG: 3,4-dihydroxyphenylacetate 2,3-dioxygenase, partial [Armatimonadota bacterium]|nr:3,4-dihydroxyphenylacetate 2,3-dioxygenase [Armatimonadota bacterium]
MTAPAILRAAHAAFRVTDLGRARAFYVDLLGLVETAASPDALCLRGYEEDDHHSLLLVRASSPGVAHMAYRVASPDDLDWLEVNAREAGLPARRVAAGEEPGQGPALRLQDPAGLPVEFVASMERTGRLLQRFDLHRGARIMRIDHFNCQVSDVEAASAWYQRQWGFRCSEYTETDDDPPRLWAVWLHRKQNVHDLALMTGIGPRLHHAGFWVPEALDVIRACDLLAGAGWHGAIERGPGRHGISNALFLYLRDPDGHRIEVYTGDYLTADPDRPAIRWALNDPRRQTFWGHAAPASW